MEKEKEYRIFISYSWTTPKHEEWVYNLGNRLMENGIEVKLDKWDLKPGQDKYEFMESMVQDETIDKVLIICDKAYSEKANERKGGVGTETQIITPEIYNNAKQEKFIPVIAEKGEEFDSYLPVYLKSRIAINMSSEEYYEEGYEKLLRLIANRPLFRKPAKGQLPSFLFEDEKPHFKTTNINKQLKHYLIEKPDKAEYFVQEFILEFKKSLEQFKITSEEYKEPYDEIVYNRINDMLCLRNDYIEFFTLLCRISNDFNIDVIIELFEDIYSYTQFQGNGINSDVCHDHYKFFTMELFLYTCLILIDNELFNKLDILLSTKYFVKLYYNNKERTFIGFRFYIDSLDSSRNNRLELKRVSITADLLVQRSEVNGINYKERLLSTDLILYYISVFKSNITGERAWFPLTYIYENKYGIEMFKKIVRVRYFEKVKILFNINTKEEMKELIRNNPISRTGYNNCFETIPSIEEFIKVDEIGTYK